MSNAFFVTKSQPPLFSDGRKIQAVSFLERWPADLVQFLVMTPASRSSFVIRPFAAHSIYPAVHGVRWHRKAARNAARRFVEEP